MVISGGHVSHCPSELLCAKCFALVVGVGNLEFFLKQSAISEGEYFVIDFDVPAIFFKVCLGRRWRGEDG